MRYLCLMTYIVLLMGCGAQRLSPEAKLPSAERLEQLMGSHPVDIPDTLTEPVIRVSPMLAMEGDDVHISCIIPSTFTKGTTITIGIADVSVSMRPLDSIETTVIIKDLPCGVHQVFCTVAEGTYTQRLEVHGEDCGVR